MKKLTLLLALYAYAANGQTVTIYPDKDASLGYHDGYGTEDNNYGSAKQLGAYVSIGQAGSGFNKNRALLYFDVSSIPAGSVIESAKINLYAFQYNPGGSFTHHNGNNASHLWVCTSSWSENTVTWNSAPSTTTANQVIFPQSTSPAQDYLDFDITQLVQYFVDNPSLNYGVLFGLEDEALGNNLSFHSSDALDVTKIPRINIKVKSASVDILEENQVAVYPNPSSRTITITGAKDLQSIQVLSAEGKMIVASQPLTVTSCDIDISGFENGVYMLVAEYENGRSIVRFVKN